MRSMVVNNLKECGFEEFSVEFINETLSSMLAKYDDRQGL
jgi:hypothetical protein